MTQRNLGIQAFNLAYDQENHLAQVSGTVTATFGYDGDGKRVLSTEGVTTTVFLGNYFEMSASGGVTSTVKYYYAGTERVAMRQNEGAVKWLLGDHLGSTSLVYDGSETIRQGYKAWGERRFILGAEELPTTFRYTGQREEASIGLYDYGARWYDLVLGRFVQPDTIIPGVGNSQAWDRYAYVFNNPLKYNDPTGHCAACVAVAAASGPPGWIIIGVVAVIAVVVIVVIAYDVISENNTEQQEGSNSNSDDQPDKSDSSSKLKPGTKVNEETGVSPDDIYLPEKKTD